MLNKKQAKKIINSCLTTGADFADCFCENTVYTTISMESGLIKDIDTKQLYGVGIRIIKDGVETYGYVNSQKFDEINSLALKLANFFEGNRKISFDKFKDFKKNSCILLSKKKVKNDDRIKNLLVLNDTAKNYSKEVIQVISNFMEHKQDVLIFSSDGIYKKDKRNHLRYSISVISKDNDNYSTGSSSKGGNFTLDKLSDFDFENMAKTAAEESVKMLYAKPCQGGIYDVVINDEFGGVIFHEACGHSLEATAVAKGMSVFCNKLNEVVASTLVTAIDDATIANEWGSSNIDDEGHLTQRNVLIENGVLKSYLVDKINGLKMNHKSTGSSRRQNYKFSPTSRMNNTYIANGTSSFDEIIKNTKKGIFAKRLGGGSVNPVTGEFNFAVNEGYLIEDGKITDPIKGVTLIGKGHETLLNIDMVGNNQSFGYGMCGSISGSIPACVGQPTIRVKNMQVGGNGDN